MMLSIVLLALLSAAGPDASEERPTVGHVSTGFGAVTFTETSVFGSDINVGRRPDGSWAGHIGSTVVDLEVHPKKLLGEDGFEIRDLKGTSFIVVHHGDAWYAKGWVFNIPLRVKYPDEMGVDGWGSYQFDGLAANGRPPMIPFVLSLYAALWNSPNLKIIESGGDIRTHKLRGSGAKRDAKAPEHK